MSHESKIAIINKRVFCFNRLASVAERSAKHAPFQVPSFGGPVGLFRRIDVFPEKQFGLAVITFFIQFSLVECFWRRRCPLFSLNLTSTQGGDREAKRNKIGNNMSNIHSQRFDLLPVLSHFCFLL